METSAGQGEHGTGKSVKGSIRKIPSESSDKTLAEFFASMPDTRFGSGLLFFAI